jgi:hypothetical protein
MKNKVQYKRTRELLGYYFIVFSFIFLFGPYQASKSGDFTASLVFERSLMGSCRSFAAL